jgi:hypothetical protein
MDVDVNLEAINEIVDVKCVMLNGSLKHRKKYIDDMKSLWLIEPADKQYKNRPPSEVFCFYILLIQNLFNIENYLNVLDTIIHGITWYFID